MTQRMEISIPSSSTVHPQAGKPFTAYNILLQLVLRSHHLQKRYSDFVKLHNGLTQETGRAPPYAIPPKGFFSNSVTSPAVAERRRQVLEEYLRRVNDDQTDACWRNTSVWRVFLDLPSSSTTIIGRGGETTGAVQNRSNDPVVWLDQLRGVKATLQSARLQLTQRDQADDIKKQHEALSQARRNLSRACTAHVQLDEGLDYLIAKSKLGQGELRRRRDMLQATVRERKGLENLADAAVSGKFPGTSNSDITTATNHAHATSPTNQPMLSSGEGTVTRASRTGRVLGGPRTVPVAPETQETRVLDNAQVLQLQQQIMHAQDEDVTLLARAVAKQKELGIQIGEELAVQTDLLQLLDEDVERVQGKVDVARKRVGKIS